MPKSIPSAERIARARKLIQQAYDYPVPPGFGRNEIAYMAAVKDLLRQAKDLVKFIPLQPTTTKEMKADVEAINAEADQASRDLLRGNKPPTS